MDHPDQHLLEQAEQYIADGHTEKAIQVLLKSKNRGLRRKVVAISGRYKQWKRQYESGKIVTEEFNAHVVRVNGELLSVISGGVVEGNGGNKRIIWLFVGVGIAIVAGLLYFKPDKAIESRDIVQDQNPSDSCLVSNRVIRVADFTKGDSDGFTNRTIGSLRQMVAQDLYLVTKAPYTDFAEFDYLPKIIKNYYSACDTSGIFVNGSIDYQAETLECVINIINLQFNPNAEISNSVQAIYFRNPSELEFSVASNADYVAKFIACLSKYYSYRTGEALDCFADLLLDEGLEKYPNFQGYLYFYLGNCFLYTGDEAEAQKSYEVAMEKNKSLEKWTKPMLKEFVEGYDQRIVAEGLNEERPSEENEPVPEVKFKKGNTVKGYPTLKLENQTWLGKNLNIEIEGSWCYGEDESSETNANCAKYGSLYTWEAAKKVCQELGPEWKLPTDEDWKEMTKQFGGYDISKEAYESLIEGGSSGFAALLGGYRDSDGEFVNLGRVGYYWSSTEPMLSTLGTTTSAVMVSVSGRNYGSKSLGFSCRCVKDN